MRKAQPGDLMAALLYHLAKTGQVLEIDTAEMAGKGLRAEAQFMDEDGKVLLRVRAFFVEGDNEFCYHD